MPRKIDSGVYVITNLKNGKQYVGHSIRIPLRWSKHRYELRRGTHHSQPLQRAWIKYGADSFEFMVLENLSGDTEALCRREQFWMDSLRPSYNVSPTATAGRTGMHHSEESKRKISERLKNSPGSKAHLAAIHSANRGVPRSPETRAKLRAAHLGKKLSPETRAKLSGKVLTQEHKDKISAVKIGTKCPFVTLALKGKPRTAEVRAKISEGHVRLNATKAGRIKAAILENPDASNAKIAAIVGCNRDTVANHRKELKCQPPQPKDSAPAVSGSQQTLDF